MPQTGYRLEELTPVDRPLAGGAFRLDELTPLSSTSTRPESARLISPAGAERTPAAGARLAQAPGPTSPSSRFHLSEVMPVDTPDETAAASWFDRAVTMALRMVPAIGGSVLGGVIGSPTVVGAPLGAAAGGAAGAAAGEAAAEWYETQHGLRSRLNPAQIAVQGALGAVPVVGRAGGVVTTALRRGGQGAVMGGVADAATRWAEGEQPTLEGTATGAVFGAAMGGSLGAVEGASAVRRRRTPVTMPRAAVPDAAFHLSELTPIDAADARPVTAPSVGPDEIVTPSARPAFVDAAANVEPETPRGLSDVVGAVAQRRPTPAAADVPHVETGAEVQPGGLFSYVATGDRADRLVQAGNVLDTEANAARASAAAQSQAVVEKLAFGAGPINTALNEAVTRIARGEPAPAVRAELLARVRTAVDTELGQPAGIDGGALAGRGQPAVAHREGAIGRVPITGSPSPHAAGATPITSAAGPRSSSTPITSAPDLQELFGGLGVVGRVQGRGDTPITPSAPRTDQAVRTFDPATASEAMPAPGTMGARQRLEGVQLKGFDKAIQPALRDVLETHHGFSEQRRDVQAWERTQKLSEQIAVDVARTLPKGRVLNAEETTAFANALATLTDRVTSLADHARRGQLDDIGRLSLEEARAAQVSVMQSLWGTVTEQGRALNAWKATKRVLESHDASFIKQALEYVQDDSAKLATLLDDLAGDPAKQYAWLKEQVRGRRPVASTVSSYFYANILSGIATHERNILSNSAQLLFGTLADAASGRVGHTRASVAGMWDALTRRGAREGPYALALPRAFQEVYYYLRQGFSPTDLHTGKLDFGRIEPEFGGGAGNPFNWPGRALNAADGFFRALVNQGERYRAAYTIAKRGTEGTLEARMATALTELPPDVLREIDEMTARAVFQETPGATTRAFLQLRDTVPAMRYVVPFVRIAANLTRQGFEVTPAGFVMKSAQRTGRVGEAARAKAALGSVALLPIAYYAATGHITGSGPSDPGARQAWLDSGKRPNSILNPLTDEWVNYGSWQPVALPMSLVANLIEAYRDAEDAPRRGQTPLVDPARQAEQQETLDHWTAIGLQTIFRTGNSLLDQSFLSGVSSLLEALNDPSRSADRFFTRLAQGFVPLSGAMRTATQLTDPVIRTPNSVREGVEAIIPGRSSTLPPLVDRFGEETESTGHPLLRGVYHASPATHDPLQPLLDRADVHPTRPVGTLRDQERAIPLSDAEQTALKQARGRTRRAAYERVHAQLGAHWRQVPAEDLHDALTQAASQAQAHLTAYAKQLKRAGRTLTADSLRAGVRVSTRGAR